MSKSKLWIWNIKNIIQDPFPLFLCLPGKNIFFCKSSYQHKTFGSHWSWSQEGSKNTKFTNILLSRLEKVYSSCSLADPKCPGVDASHTSATTSMSQSFSTFNFMDVKNIEVPLARSAPSNTCQSQSIALSELLRILQWSCLRQHFPADGNTCNPHSCRLWSTKWGTTAASLELGRCLCNWWQSDGKEQSLVSAALPPTKCHLQTRRRENVFPRTKADTG